MGIEKLREQLKDKVEDDFEQGTVIRWVASQKYTYVAVKTPVGWATSASRTNRLVSSVVDYEELTEILSRSETSNVEVATAWESV